MKYLLPTIVFVTICCCKLSAENYIEYQRGITKAENLMFDSLFHESVKQYKTVFDSYSFNFPRDCMIAAQAATYIKDDTSAFYFLRKAVRYGTHIERIKIVRLLEPLQNSPHWKIFINDYDSLRNAYYESIDIPYRDVCNELKLKESALHTKDQGVVDGKYKKNGFFTNRYIVWNPFLRKKWKNCCKEVLTVIDSLIPIYGFPSYRTIGSADSIIFNNITLSGAQILTTYYHYVGAKKSEQFLFGLKEEVIKGNLSARDYATLMEFQHREHKEYRSDKSMYYIRWEVYPFSDKIYPNEDVANINREEIGLSNCYYERVRKLWQHLYNYGKPNSFELFYYEF